MTSRIMAFAMMFAMGLVSLVVTPSAVLAQTAGSISGSVTDGSGHALGNAHISISGPVSTTIPVHSDGTFTVSVPPGIYSITTEASGFETSRQDNIVVVSGTAVALKTTLFSASLTTIGRISSSSTSVSSSPAAATTLTAAAIQSQGQSQLVNILDQIPGVEVFRYGGGSNEPGANAAISIRGAQPYESQVLLDGHPVNTSANGVDGFNTTFINTLLLGGAEVSKGPGNMPNTVEDAVGGTINFRTPSITATPTGTLLAGYDSFNEFTYAAKFSDTFGKLGVLVGVARESSPGYLTPHNLFGGNNSFYPSTAYGNPFYPNPDTSFGPGTSYVGVLNFSYPATSDFSSDTQLAKIAYNFSPVTSVQFENYSTQSYVDETGNNVGNVYATIVPCITTGRTPAPTCTPSAGVNYNQNYTATPYLGYVGQVVPINWYAGYPNTYEFVNQPIYTGEFRTVIGPGSFLARYYDGSVSRTVTQGAAPFAISPCYTPACAWDPLGNPDDNDNGYPGEPYTEPFIDILHGLDAQYTVPFGPNSITLGFDRHVDQAIFEAIYALGYPPDPVLSDYYTLAPPSVKYFTTQSLSESLRGTFQLLPKLTLDAGGYLSSTSYVGNRFDPRAGLTFKPNPNVSVRASWGSAFVSPYYNLIIPSNKQGVSGGTLTLATTNFSPETSTGYDVGADVKYGHDSLLSADLYDTTIYNRYATVTLPITGVYNGRPYSMETLNTSDGDALIQGAELSLLRAPAIGFGYHVALDLLRDYSYNQVNPSNYKEDLFLALPGDGVQAPNYPFSKIRSEVSYAMKHAGTIHFGATSYGANNAFGQAGFTLFDTSIKVPFKKYALNIGATNLFNHDNYQVGGIYYGGTTYETLGGGVGPENLEFVAPRVVFAQATVQLGK